MGLCHNLLLVAHQSYMLCLIIFYGRFDKLDENDNIDIKGFTTWKQNILEIKCYLQWKQKIQAPKMLPKARIEPGTSNYKSDTLLSELNWHLLWFFVTGCSL